MILLKKETQKSDFTQKRAQKRDLLKKVLKKVLRKGLKEVLKILSLLKKVHKKVIYTKRDKKSKPHLKSNSNQLQSRHIQ